MSDRDDSLRELSQIRDTRIRELMRYLRWTMWLNVLVTTTLVSLGWLWDRPILFYFATVVVISTAADFAAYRLSANRRLTAAIGTVAFGLIVLIISLFAFGIQLFPVVVALILLPIMMAMPYVSDRGVLLTTIVVTLVMSAGSYLSLQDPILDIPLSQDWLIKTMSISVVLVVAVVAMTLWYNAKLLWDTVEQAQVVKTELTESEKSLEAQIEQRTVELVEANEELSRAGDVAQEVDRLKSGFLASMSHELRTPLNAVLGFSEMLDQEYLGKLNDKQREYVRDILKSGQHLKLLIDDILDLSKVSRGALELETGTFSFDTIADEAMLLVQYRATQKGVSLNKSISDSIGQIVGDERKIKQTLINLLGNAVKFTPAGGDITLAAAMDDGSLDIRVRDTGVGIALKDQELIFDAFGQASDAAPREDGTGLGLALCRRFIELHGGTISVSSRPGEGAEFRIRMPLKKS